MKTETMYRAITEIDEQLIAEAAATTLRRRPVWKILGAVAASAAVIAAILLIPTLGGTKQLPCVDAAGTVPAHATEPDVSFTESVKTFSYTTASRLLSGKTGNTNYAPLSLYYALSLAASGARGETQTELLSLLGTSDPEALISECGNLFAFLSPYADTKYGKMKLLNSMWLAKDITWDDAFISRAATDLYTVSFRCDFSDKKTAEAMKSWIDKQTNGRLSPNCQTNENQLLSIISTICFEDEWAICFPAKNTETGDFTRSDGTNVTASFMHTSETEDFFVGDGFIRANKRLKNAGEMIFILPDENTSLESLVSSPDRLQSAFESGEEKTGRITWQVPKFSFGTKTDCIALLKQCGVHTVFSESADLGGMTAQEEMAYIDRLRQDTHIGIDENGVEAAGYTELDAQLLCAPEDCADMILDRPFLYGITAKDGTILFIGVCQNPVA